MWKFVLLIAALIQAIECRTNQDVINDFEPVFRERDEAFDALQNLTNATMIPKFSLFQEELTQKSMALIYDYLPKIVEKINNNITDYIRELGLDEQTELTKDCLNKLNENINEVTLSVAGEVSACTTLAWFHYEKILVDFKDTLQSLDNAHVILNITREECVKQSTPFEVQTCLINNLYTFYIPYIKEITDYTNKLIDEWSAKLITIEKEIIAVSLELTKKDISSFETRITDDTRICLWFIQTPHN